MRFFKVRQGEWQTYLEACKPIAVRQVPHLDLALHTSYCAEQQVGTIRVRCAVSHLALQLW